MVLFFLSASCPLTKTHTKTEKGYSTTSFPMVKTFTSYEESAEITKEAFSAITSHARQGHCLLKGQLKAPLVNESRAGAVDAYAKSPFICFDLDAVKVANSEEFIAKYLPEPFKHCSYVEQLSASCGITAAYKAHLFFFLDPSCIGNTQAGFKEFVMRLNLTLLQDQLWLNPGNMSLGYPLDPQINHNSTPIFIAPPTCNGFTDPVLNRIQLIKKANDSIRDFSFAPMGGIPVDILAKKAMQKLRDASDLPTKKPKYSTKEGIETLQNVDPTYLSDAPFEERGFVYLPITANRYTYYHPAGKPDLIFNFRGEPVVETKKFLPDYWAEVNKGREKKLLVAANAPSEDCQYFVFRDVQLDQYYNGWCKGDTLELYPVKSKARLADFARQNGIAMPDPIPDWIQEFDPKDNSAIDFENKRINTFRLTRFLTTAIADETPVNEVPETIAAIIMHVVGDDQECYDRFINWLAFIVQKREKTKTAWIFQGVEGTGKGVLFNLILRPILGAVYCMEKMLSDLTDDFNGWVQKCLLVFFDEVKQDARGNPNNRKIPNLLKHYVTEPVTNLRMMYTNPFQTKLYNNVIIATNHANALYISASDRRFTVCPAQPCPLLPPENLDDLIRAELQPFTTFLMQFPVSEEDAHTAITNAAKIRMRADGMGDIETFFNELKRGNFEYLSFSYLDVLGRCSSDFAVYKNIIECWADRYMATKGTIKEGTITMRREEVMAVFIFLLRLNDITAHKFTRLLHSNGLEMRKAGLGELKYFDSQGQRAYSDFTSVLDVKINLGEAEIETVYNMKR